MTNRVPKSKEGQDPDTHSDLYTDEDPKGTIHGLGFTDAAKARESVAKIEKSDRTHAHKVQAAIAMSQRAKVASKRAKNPEKKKNLAAAAEVYFAFIEKMKKITKKRTMKEFKDYIKEDCGCGCDKELSETSGEYQGKKVDLDNPFRLPQGSKKKFGVYVKNDKGNVVKVTFGDPNLSIKRDHEDRLKNFRARHNCDEKNDKTTPGYWSCKFWEKDSPVSKLLSKGDVTEGIDTDIKGWIHPKTKKSYITKRMTPYHVQFIVQKPRDFGITVKDILGVLEKWNDSMDAPDPAEEAKDDFLDLKTGKKDMQKLVEYLAMKKGWYRVVGASWSEITGLKINDKIISDVLNIMEDEGVIPYDGQGIKSLVCGEYRPDGDYMVEKSIKILEGDAIVRALRGKKTGKRTEIGQTMAMFRGESLEISQLDEAVDPKDMLRIFNDLGKGDSIKVKFKSVMATASKNFVELVVTSGRRTVGKAKVERIILKSKKNPGGVKYFLYRRGDNVSFAMGDMAAIVDDIQENVQIDEGLKDRLVAKLLKMTPVAKLIAKNPQTTHLAMSLLAIPAVNKILDRANYDNLQKVIDIAEFMKDTVASLGAETEKRGRGGDVSLTGLGDSPHIGSPSRNLMHKQVEDRVMKYSEFLKEKTYAKSGLGKWMNQQSAGGGPGWDRYGTDGEKLGKCGDAKEGEPYSACLSKQKADKLGKEKIASFVRRKRYAQDKAKRGDIGDGGKGQKPINVKTGVTDKDPKKKGIQDDWSAKYKKSIDCNNPQGFSQRAHCQGRKKKGLDS